MQVNEVALDRARGALKALKEEARIILTLVYPYSTRALLIAALEEDMLEGWLCSSESALQFKLQTDLVTLLNSVLILAVYLSD